MREGAESNMRKIAGNFHNWQKKIKLRIKEDLQKQEGDIKGPLHQVTSLKSAENQQQTKLEIGGNFLNLIENSYKKLIAIIYKISKKVRMPALTTFIQHCIGRPN